MVAKLYIGCEKAAFLLPLWNACNPLDPAYAEPTSLGSHIFIPNQFTKQRKTESTIKSTKIFTNNIKNSSGIN